MAKKATAKASSGGSKKSSKSRSSTSGSGRSSRSVATVRSRPRSEDTQSDMVDALIKLSLTLIDARPGLSAGEGGDAGDESGRGQQREQSTLHDDSLSWIWGSPD